MNCTDISTRHWRHIFMRAYIYMRTSMVTCSDDILSKKLRSFLRHRNVTEQQSSAQPGGAKTLMFFFFFFFFFFSFTVVLNKD